MLKRIECGSFHKGWTPLIDRILPELQKIESIITRGQYNPAPQNVLRFLDSDPAAISVVILGQDPYPDPAAATGRAFEVGTLTSWNAPFRQTSLKNIVRVLFRDYTGNELTFSSIKEEIAASRFPVLPPRELFASWDSQGVLLLNTALTCETGNPGSHAELWENVTPEIIRFICATSPAAHWFIWGGHAESYTTHITRGTLHRSSHPAARDMSGENAFLKTTCFQNTADRVRWLG